MPVILPVIGPVEVFVTVMLSRLLLNWVMFTVDVTPVFMPVKVNVSARALVPANANVINAPKVRIPLVRKLFIFLDSVQKVGRKILCAPLEFRRHCELI